MKTAIFSVVYPGIENFFQEFLFSLSMQSDKKFTLFLINDGLNNINKFIQQINFDIKIMDASVGEPASLRKKGIRWIIETGADVIIFADADDYCAENRVEVSIDILDIHNFVFNELLLTGRGFPEQKQMLASRFMEREEIDYTRIQTANFVGLSNTALRIKCIPETFEKIPDNTIAFDWAFFALCLHAGEKGVFTKKTSTYYRQHDNNVASPGDFQEEQILLGVRVKSEHYKFLSGLYKEYVVLSDIFSGLLVKLKSDEALRKKYCQAVREQSPVAPLWWEPMKSLEELGL